MAAQRMEETKAAYSHRVENGIPVPETVIENEDGSKVYVFRCEIKEIYKERKKWETVIVLLRPGRKSELSTMLEKDESPCFWVEYSFIVGSSGSGSSSGWIEDTIEAGVWKALDSRYHSW